MKMPLNAAAATILVAAAAFAQCSSRWPACSSPLSSSAESFCSCLEQASTVLKSCLFVCVAGSVAQQPVLSETVVFGECVCGRVSTGVVQTCAVTYHRSFITNTSRPPTLEKHRWRMQVTADQGHSSRGKLVAYPPQLTTHSPPNLALAPEARAARANQNNAAGPPPQLRQRQDAHG